jgi:small GTP-binding protein
MVVLRCKVGVVGDGTVGKTAILQMVFSNNVQFPKNYAMTMGAENTVKEIPVNQHTTVELHIIDVGGQDVYARNAQDFLADIDMFMGVYDIGNKLTFEGLPKWLDKARAGSRTMPGVIVANKIDLKDKAEVAEHQGEQLARKYGARLIQASALRGVGCIEALQAIAEEWARRYEERARFMQTLQ